MVQPAWDQQWPNKVTARYSSRRNDTCPQTLVTECQQQLYHDSQITERAYVPMGTVVCSYHAAIKGTNYWYGNTWLDRKTIVRNERTLTPEIPHYIIHLYQVLGTPT